MNVELIADEIINNINKINLNSFSKTQLENELRLINCTYWSKVVQFLNDLKVFNQLDTNLYTISKEIIKSDLIKVIEKYKLKKNKQLRFSRQGKLTSYQKANIEVMDFDKACKIVRSFGYKIFKEV